MGDSSTTVDMATALELPLGTENEAKFIALRNMHLKKIKQLMASLDNKDKEIAKLKVTSKESRRTEMIQALRNKIRDLELINDVMKEELAVKSEQTPEAVNEFIMRKTLGGPKRFRPLTREEMENKIYDLEKKLSRKPVAAAAAAESDAKHANDNAAQSKPTRSGHTTTAADVGRHDDAKSSSTPGAGASLVDVAALLEEAQRLRIDLRARETVADRQRDEISRLRSRNAELVAAEEEVTFFQQQITSLQENNDMLSKAVQEATSQLAEAMETASRAQAEAALVGEHDKGEVVRLRAECEKLLKQNAALLQNLSESELSLQRYEQEKLAMKERGEAAENSSTSKDGKIKALEEKLRRTEERYKALETRTAALESEVAQVDGLRNQLREKNIQLKELRRNYEERERVLQLRATEEETAGVAASKVREEQKEGEGKDDK